MLKESKNPGDLVAAARSTSNSLYVEGTVKRVYRDEEQGDLFYEILWEDGKNFGEVFYEAELDEIDAEESEATLRAGMSSLLDSSEMDSWFDFPNPKLGGRRPGEALVELGFSAVSSVLINDYVAIKIPTSQPAQ